MNTADYFIFKFKFSYVWVKLIKKVPYTSPSAFDHFAGHFQRLGEIVCCCEFYLYSFEAFLPIYHRWGWLIVMVIFSGWVRSFVAVSFIYIYLKFFIPIYYRWGWLIVTVNCIILIIELKLLPCSYVYVWANTLGKLWTLGPPCFTNYELNNSTSVLL